MQPTVLSQHARGLAHDEAEGARLLGSVALNPTRTVGAGATHTMRHDIHLAHNTRTAQKVINAESPPTRPPKLVGNQKNQLTHTHRTLR